MTEPSPGVPQAVLRAFGWQNTTPSPLIGGLINQTFIVDTGGERFVLQRLHPVFDASVNLDLEAVTERLAQQGMTTPRLCPARDGLKSVIDDNGACWRATTFIAGRSTHRVESLEQARAAGALVAQFHLALDGWFYEYVHVRAGVHDTGAHLATLEKRASGDAPDDETRRLSDDILEHARTLPAIELEPRRHAHGDLKISNLLFETSEPWRGCCLVDLDTTGRLPMAHELGDAFRSWCNPRGEDTSSPNFDIGVFSAAIAGYARTAPGLLGPGERQSLVAGIDVICTELAARFCIDAYDDSYFGWDASRFPSRVAHNKERATGQLNLARSVRRQRAAAEAAVTRAYSE